MRQRVLAVVVLLLTATVFYLTYARVVWYESFYAYQDKPSGSLPVKVLLAACLGVLMVLTARMARRAWLFLFLAVVVGTLLQFAFAYTEGRGFDGLRARALAGHGQFIAVALVTDDPLDTLRHYEELAAQGKLRQFPQTKPPGTLLFYVLTERISEFVTPFSYNPDVHERDVVNFLAAVWPTVAALAVLPLYWLTLLLGGGARDGRVAVALYLTTPSFVLVTLHTDQVLFPLLFLSVLALFVWGLVARTTATLVLRGAAAGVILWLASFCDFPLALAAVFCVALWFPSWRADAKPRDERLRRALALAAAVTAGVLVPSIAIWAIAGYNPIVRWHAAIAFHAAWRHVPAVVGLDIGRDNVVEFVDWAGVPLTVLAVASVWAPVAAGEARLRASAIAIMTSLVAVVAYLAFFSHTAAETARLWLFLVPELCLAAAVTLSDLRARFRFAVPAVLALQFATVYLIKMTHDFW